MCGKGQTPSISAVWTVLFVACMFYGMDAFINDIMDLIPAAIGGFSVALVVICVMRRINPIRFMIEEQREENFRRRLISELKKLARAQKR